MKLLFALLIILTACSQPEKKESFVFIGSPPPLEEGQNIDRFKLKDMDISVDLVEIKNKKKTANKSKNP